MSSESGSSRASGDTARSKRKRSTTEQLVARIRRKLATPPTQQLAVAEHRDAVVAMERLRDALLAGVSIPADTRESLTCTGIAVQRRAALSAQQCTSDEAERVGTTGGLLFALIIMCHAASSHMDGDVADDALVADEDEDEDEDAVALKAWAESSYEQDLRRATAGGASVSSWDAVLREPGALCHTCLRLCVRRMSRLTQDDVARHAVLFFWASGRALATTLLDGAGRMVDGSPFVSLETTSTLANAQADLQERLLAIADCAESEAGQAILRDLILSFRLPRAVVHTRRHCLLSREVNRIATSTHTEALSTAHEAALRGARWSFERDDDELHKTCALLAGLAVLLFKDPTSIRRDDMFYGRVSLPFLETMPPAGCTLRLALLEHSNEWVVYTLDSDGTPHVRLRDVGFEGLCQAIVLFTNDGAHRG